MKKIQFLFLAMLISFTTFASGNSDLVSLSSMDRKIVLDYTKLADSKTTITIKDVNGLVLFSQTTAKPASLQNQFKFTKIDRETFTLVVENNHVVYESTYQIKNGIAVQKEEGSRVYKPVFSTKGNKVGITLLNPGLNEVTIKVTDDEGSILGETIKMSDRAITKSFDFSNYSSDALISVYINGKVFSKNIEL